MSKTLKQTLNKKETPNDNKGMKRYSTSVKNASYNMRAKLLHTFPYIPRNGKNLKI